MMKKEKQMTNDEITEVLNKIEAKGFQLAALTTAAVTINLAKASEADEELAVLCFTGMGAETTSFHVANLANDIASEIDLLVMKIRKNIDNTIR